MTREEFVKQMNRLASVFGANPYPEERRNLIWNEMNTLSVAAFTRMVSEMIGNQRQAPLLPEFRELAGREREAEWEAQKRVHAREAKEAMRTLFSPEDIKFFCKSICDRIKGELPDDKFHGLTRMLKEMPGPPRCPFCDGTGYIWESYPDSGDTVYRCKCPEGEKKPNGISIVPQELFSARQKARTA